MPKALPRALAISVALLLAGGCASSGPYWNRDDQGAAEATELRERVTRLEGQLAKAESENAALRARADELAQELARSRQEGPAAAMEAAAAAAAEAPTPPRARPEIEQSDLEEPGDNPESPVTAAGDAAPAPPNLTEATLRTPYERSLGLLEDGHLAEAEEGFRRFLAENPDSDLADNAQFWLAESMLRRGNVAAALAGFRAVVENYPEANKVPDALLKVGACLAALGEAESAATVYRELMARFPDTAAAETARLRLGTP